MSIVPQSTNYARNHRKVFFSNSKMSHFKAKLEAQLLRADQMIETSTMTMELNIERSLSAIKSSNILAMDNCHKSQKISESLIRSEVILQKKIIWRIINIGNFNKPGWGFYDQELNYILTIVTLLFDLVFIWMRVTVTIVVDRLYTLQIPKLKKHEILLSGLAWAG